MEQPTSPSLTARRTRRRGIRSPAALRLAVLSAACGCAVGPDFKRPEVTVPVGWQNAGGNPRLATQGAADSQWWKAFADPALDRLVDLATRQNLPLQIAGLRIVEARAQFGVATGLQFPQTQALAANLTAIG